MQLEAGKRKAILRITMSPATAFTVALLLALAAPAQAQAQESPRSRDVGFVATPMSLVNGMLDLAGVGDTDVVYDLGSGDGRIVIAAALRGARAVGVELDSVLVEESRASADTAGVGARTEFRRDDLFTTDVSPATVVTLYLGNELNRRLRPIFLRDLRPGTRVVSQAFDMGDWRPDSVVTVRSHEVAATPVYFWLIPADVAGTWTVTVERADARAERRRLTLTQRYQAVSGNAQAISLRGDSLAFSLDRRRFVGRVTGNEARGTVAVPGGRPRPWHALRTSRP